MNAGGGQFASGPGAAEGVGGVPFFGSCGHFGGMMNNDRTMAAVGLYPNAKWDSAKPMENYSAAVLFYFAQNYGFQSYSNPFFLTYQPIPSGSHVVLNGS